MLRSSFKFLLLGCLLCAIAACGQKGDLVKPGAVTTQANAAEVAR